MPELTRADIAARLQASCACFTREERRLASSCSTCAYGVCPGCSFPDEIECHRHSPVVVQLRGTRGQFPRVKRGAICGDYVDRD